MKKSISTSSKRTNAAGSQPKLSARMALSRPLGEHHLGFLRKFQERKSFVRATGAMGKQMPRVGIGLKKTYRSLKTTYTVPARYRFLKAPKAEQLAPDAWRSLDMALPGHEPSASSSPMFSQTSLPSFQGPPPPPTLSPGQAIPRMEDDPAFRGGAVKAAAQSSARKPAPAPNHRLYRRVEEITPGGAEKKAEPPAPSPAPSAAPKPHAGQPQGKPTVRREPEPSAPRPVEKAPAQTPEQPGEAQKPQAAQPAPIIPTGPVHSHNPRRPRPQTQAPAVPASHRMAAHPAAPPDLQTGDGVVRREIEPAQVEAPKLMAARTVEKAVERSTAPSRQPVRPAPQVIPARAAASVVEQETPQAAPPVPPSTPAAATAPPIHGTPANGPAKAPGSARGRAAHIVR